MMIMMMMIMMTSYFSGWRVELVVLVVLLQPQLQSPQAESLQQPAASKWGALLQRERYGEGLSIF